MTDAYDPESLCNSHRPSFATVETPEDIRKMFVANASILDNGWLSVVCWDGTIFKVPPQRVWNVERVETEQEWHDDGSQDKWVADESLQEKAKELAEGGEKVDL